MHIFDAVSPLERIQLSSALAGLVKELSGDLSALARVRTTAAISNILQQLGAVSQPSAELVFDLSRPAESIASLSRYLDTGLESLPEALRPLEAATVAELARQLNSPELGAKAHFASGVTLQKHFGPAFEEMTSRGLVADIDKEALAAKLEEATAVSKALLNGDPVWQGLQKKMAELSDGIQTTIASLDPRIRTAIQAVRSAEQQGSKDVAEVAYDLVKSLQQQRAAAIETYQKAWAAAEKQAKERAKNFRADQQAKANAMVAAEGGAVIDAIKARSPVSAEQAMAWANSQRVDDSAWKRLAKNGYPKAQVLQDMADFYQLSGGKASAISLVNTGSRRAYASNINTSTNEKIIAIDTNFNRTILFHELAHHLENDPIAKAAANGYIEKRRESPRVYSLRSLTGNKGYGPGEGAYKDDFLDPYIGKHYRDNTTEVFSMAVQYLANPLDAARLYAKDPELFALITGYLGSELTPAMRARLNLHAGKIDEKTQLEQQVASAITQVAKAVSLTESRWFEEFRAAKDWEARYAVGRAGGDAQKMKTVGAYEPRQLYVLEGPVRTGGRGRKTKGYMILRDTGGYPDAVFAGRTLEEAKALLAAAIKKDGNLYEAKTEYFGQGLTPAGVQAIQQLAATGV